MFPFPLHLGLSRKPARPNDVVFHSVSLDVAVDKTLALVGPSGGGKSTMTKLLLRFYDPTSGSVTLDGTDIKSLNVAWYRQQVGSAEYMCRVCTWC